MGADYGVGVEHPRIERREGQRVEARRPGRPAQVPDTVEEIEPAKAADR